ncbi:MAG: AAA family ATPase [Bryobacteraceae bacterium]|jgi:general secretion pathway protein A
MYLQSFGLRIPPFGMASDPAMLFLSPAHREALAGLCYGLLERKGFLLVLGQAGTGKTTLLTKAMQSLPAGRLRFATIYNPTLTPSEFLESVLLGFGIDEIPPSKPQRLLKLRDQLLDLHTDDQIAALVIDEAHKLSPELLEEVRLLGNLENRAQKMLQLVLAGQSDLATILNRDDLQQLKQRVAVRLTLRPLTRPEVTEYVRYRWVRAGGSRDLPFTPAALELVERFSHGIPRVVNAICDGALLSVFGEEGSMVEPRHVIQSCTDLDLMELPLEAAPAEDREARQAVLKAVPPHNGNGADRRTMWWKWTSRRRMAS